MLRDILIKILSIIDSYHDFYKSPRTDKEKKDKEKKDKDNIIITDEDKNSTIINKLFKDYNFITYLFSEITDISNEELKLLEYIFGIDKIDKITNIIYNNKIVDVNDSNYKKSFIKKLLKINKYLGIENEMLRIIDDIILENFKLIFITNENADLLKNYVKKDNKININNLNIILTNISKIRIPMYYLIKKISFLGNHNFFLSQTEITTYIKNISEIHKINNLLHNKINILFEKLYIIVDLKINKEGDISKNKIIGKYIFTIDDKNKISFTNKSVFDNKNDELKRKKFMEILELIINKNNNQLIIYIIDNPNILEFIQEIKTELEKKVYTYNFYTNFTEIIDLLLEIIPVIKELDKNKIVKKTDKIIIYDLINYIIEIYKDLDICIDNYNEVVKNIKINFEKINLNKNITYPIGVLLQDNTAFIDLINNLDFRTVYPVHHKYFDASVVANNALVDSIDEDILQLVDIGVDLDNVKKEPSNLYNINLDHNDENPIVITSMNIDYYLSCTDNNKEINCQKQIENSDENIYDNDTKLAIQKKILFFKSNSSEKIIISGYCVVNSVIELSNILVLLINYKEKKTKISFDKNYFIETTYNSIIWYNMNNRIQPIFLIKVNERDISEYIKEEQNFHKLCQIILSCKRFGDWYAQNLAKQNYFFVKTNDFWANIYGLVLGTPCIFIKKNNYYLYNFNPSNYLLELFESGKSNITIHSKVFSTKNKFVIYNQDSIVNSKNFNSSSKFDDLDIIELVENDDLVENGRFVLKDFERYYFAKYLKYKKKYLELKNV
jgi:hypothetical protein